MIAESGVWSPDCLSEAVRIPQVTDHYLRTERTECGRVRGLPHQHPEFASALSQSMSHMVAQHPGPTAHQYHANSSLRNAATATARARTGNTATCTRDRCGSSASEEEGTMPFYLSRFSYTPETWARLIGNPEDRRTAAQAYIESVGGKLHGFWYAFGAHDGYNLWEAPDNVSMAAVALAIAGGGALSSFETTVLLTVEETMDALRKAEKVKYRAPGAAVAAD